MPLTTSQRATLDEENRHLAALPTSTQSHKGCTVLVIHDGDTITVSVPGRKSHVVLRIAEIDAPEIHAFTWPTQPGALEAKAEVVKFIGPGMVCDIAMNKFDPRTQRWIGHVKVNGVDLSLHMIAFGCAWPYLPFPRSKIPSTAALAKKAGVGLWADPNAIEPSVWRKMTHPKKT